MRLKNLLINLKNMIMNHTITFNMIHSMTKFYIIFRSSIFKLCMKILLFTSTFSVFNSWKLFFYFIESFVLYSNKIIKKGITYPLSWADIETICDLLYQNQVYGQILHESKVQIQNHFISKLPFYLQQIVPDRPEYDVFYHQKLPEFFDIYFYRLVVDCLSIELDRDPLALSRFALNSDFRHIVFTQVARDYANMLIVKMNEMLPMIQHAAEQPIPLPLNYIDWPIVGIQKIGSLNTLQTFYTFLYHLIIEHFYTFYELYKYDKNIMLSIPILEEYAQERFLIWGTSLINDLGIFILMLIIVPILLGKILYPHCIDDLTLRTIVMYHPLYLRIRVFIFNICHIDIEEDWNILIYLVSFGLYPFIDHLFFRYRVGDIRQTFINAQDIYEHSEISASSIELSRMHSPLLFLQRHLLFKDAEESGDTYAPSLYDEDIIIEQSTRKFDDKNGYHLYSQDYAKEFFYIQEEIMPDLSQDFMVNSLDRFITTNYFLEILKIRNRLPAIYSFELATYLCQKKKSNNDTNTNTMVTDNEYLFDALKQYFHIFFTQFNQYLVTKLPDFMLKVISVPLSEMTDKQIYDFFQQRPHQMILRLLRDETYDFRLKVDPRLLTEKLEQQFARESAYERLLRTRYLFGAGKEPHSISPFPNFRLEKLREYQRFNRYKQLQSKKSKFTEFGNWYADITPMNKNFLKIIDNKLNWNEIFSELLHHGEYSKSTRQQIEYYKKLMQNFPKPFGGNYNQGSRYTGSLRPTYLKKHVSVKTAETLPYSNINIYKRKLERQSKFFLIEKKLQYKFVELLKNSKDKLSDKNFWKEINKEFLREKEQLEQQVILDQINESGIHDFETYRLVLDILKKQKGADDRKVKIIEEMYKFNPINAYRELDPCIGKELNQKLSIFETSIEELLQMNFDEFTNFRKRHLLPGWIEDASDFEKYLYVDGEQPILENLHLKELDGRARRERNKEISRILEHLQEWNIFRDIKKFIIETIDGIGEKKKQDIEKSKDGKMKKKEFLLPPVRYLYHLDSLENPEYTWKSYAKNFKINKDLSEDHKILSTTEYLWESTLLRLEYFLAKFVRLDEKSRDKVYSVITYITNKEINFEDIIEESQEIALREARKVRLIEQEIERRSPTLYNYYNYTRFLEIVDLFLPRLAVGITTEEDEVLITDFVRNRLFYLSYINNIKAEFALNPPDPDQFSIEDDLDVEQVINNEINNINIHNCFYDVRCDYMRSDGKNLEFYYKTYTQKKDLYKKEDFSKYKKRAHNTFIVYTKILNVDEKNLLFNSNDAEYVVYFPFSYSELNTFIHRFNSVFNLFNLEDDPALDFRKTYLVMVPIEVQNSLEQQVGIKVQPTRLAFPFDTLHSFFPKKDRFIYTKISEMLKKENALFREEQNDMLWDTKWDIWYKRSKQFRKGKVSNIFNGTIRNSELLKKNRYSPGVTTIPEDLIDYVKRNKPVGKLELSDIGKAKRDDRYGLFIEYGHDEQLRKSIENYSYPIYLKTLMKDSYYDVFSEEFNNEFISDRIGNDIMLQEMSENTFITSQRFIRKGRQTNFLPMKQELRENDSSSTYSRIIQPHVLDEIFKLIQRIRSDKKYPEWFPEITTNLLLKLKATKDTSECKLLFDLAYVYVTLKKVTDRFQNGNGMSLFDFKLRLMNHEKLFRPYTGFEIFTIALRYDKRFCNTILRLRQQLFLRKNILVDYIEKMMVSIPRDRFDIYRYNNHSELWVKFKSQDQYKRIPLIREFINEGKLENRIFDLITSNNHLILSDKQIINLLRFDKSFTSYTIEKLCDSLVFVRKKYLNPERYIKNKSISYDSFSIIHSNEIKKWFIDYINTIVSHRYLLSKYDSILSVSSQLQIANLMKWLQQNQRSIPSLGADLMRFVVADRINLVPFRHVNGINSILNYKIIRQKSLSFSKTRDIPNWSILIELNPKFLYDEFRLTGLYNILSIQDVKKGGTDLLIISMNLYNLQRSFSLLQNLSYGNPIYHWLDIQKDFRMIRMNANLVITPIITSYISDKNVIMNYTADYLKPQEMIVIINGGEIGFNFKFKQWDTFITEKTTYEVLHKRYIFREFAIHYFLIDKLGLIPGSISYDILFSMIYYHVNVILYLKDLF